MPRNVRVLTVAPADMREYLSLSGPAHPVRGTVLSAEEGGRVDSIRHDKGAQVDAGALLVVQDRRLLGAEMKANLAARDLSGFNVERMRQLFEANSISEIELLETETQHRQAEAAAEAARIRYERAAVAAPFAGIITDRYVELGQQLAPGVPVARLVDPFVLKLEGSVTEREIAWVEAGKRAEVIFDSVSGGVEGYVHWVGFEADPLTGKFKVEIRIDNRDLRINPGVIGRARVLRTLHEQVISIPRDAVLQKADGPVAFVVDGDRARRRSLRLGSDQGLMVIVEEGLRSGDRLIVRGQREIHDGSAVLVQEESHSPDGTAPGDPGVVSRAGAQSDGWVEPPAVSEGIR